MISFCSCYWIFKNFTFGLLKQLVLSKRITMLSMRFKRWRVLSSVWTLRWDQKCTGRLLWSRISHTRSHVRENLQKQSGHSLRLVVIQNWLDSSALHICHSTSISFFIVVLAKGWKTTIRRCASRSDFSVSWGCRYYIDEVGLYVETCYCSDRDGCNSALKTGSTRAIIFLTLAVQFIIFKRLLSY